MSLMYKELFKSKRKWQPDKITGKAHEQIAHRKKNIIILKLTKRCWISFRNREMQKKKNYLEITWLTYHFGKYTKVQEHSVRPFTTLLLTMQSGSITTEKNVAISSAMTDSTIMSWQCIFQRWLHMCKMMCKQGWIHWSIPGDGQNPKCLGWGRPKYITANSQK